MVDIDWGALGGKALDYFSTTGAARGQAEAEKRAAEEEQARYEARKRAYEAMIGKAGEDYKIGESQFMTEANLPLPELQQMQEDIVSGQAKGLQEGTGSMRAALATTGTRGPQAAEQLRRYIGETSVGAQKDINKMKYDEAGRRAEERRSYTAGKARAGQTAGYTPPTF